MRREAGFIVSAIEIQDETKQATPVPVKEPKFA